MSYPIVTITDPLQSDYTFEFVGAQPGEWRVTTLAGTGFRIRLRVPGTGLRSLSEFWWSLKVEQQTHAGQSRGCFRKTETSPLLVAGKAALRQGSRRRAYTQLTQN